MIRSTIRCILLPTVAGLVLLATGCGSDHGDMPDMHHGDTAPTASGGHGMPGIHDMDAMPAGDGLSPIAAGLTLRLSDKTLPAGQAGALRFQILGAGGKPVTTFTPDQTKLMHFYLIRSDLTGFQHLHPDMAADGTWTANVAAPQSGTWRVYTSFVAADAGKQTAAVLGDQVTVPGTAAPQPLPAPATSAQVDGYTLTVNGEAMAGMTHTLTVTVTRDGKPVNDLQPYLDTYAHLTAFHDGDLAFAHLHPHGTVNGDHGGPDLDFEAMLTRPGNWRLFLQFQAGGTLHTAALTLHVA